MSLTPIVAEIDQEISRLQQARDLLVSNGTGMKKKRGISAAGRKKIAEAMRKRWAEKKKAQKRTI